MGRNILVVEDDHNISDLIHMYLVKEGFDVRIAGDGGKAIEEFQKQAPDLILLDICLLYTSPSPRDHSAGYSAAGDGRLGSVRQNSGDQQGSHYHADCQKRGF